MNEARLREEIRRLVNEQRQLNRRLQQQQHVPGSLSSSSGLPGGGGGAADDYTSFLAGRLSSGRGPGGGGSDGSEGNGERSGNSSEEQPSGVLDQQQQRLRRKLGEGSGGGGGGGAEERAASFFSARGRPSSSSLFASSSGSSSARTERHNRKDVPFGAAASGAAGSGFLPSAAGTAPAGSSCNIPARALVAERLLAMGVPPGDMPQLKRPLTPGERPVYDFQGPEFQVEKRPKVMVADEKTVTRDRRMFGALAGHLRRAQQQLQREQGTDVAHKHKQQEERVAQKLALSQKNIAEIARLEWQEKRQQERLRLEEVSMELVNKENELMRVHLVKHYKNMERFIGTEAQPTLFWLPAKWDDATRRLQEQTRLWIQTKIDHIQSTDYTYRPQQACNGTAAAATDEEGGCSSAAAEGGEGGTAAAGNAKAADVASEAADGKGRDARAGGENCATICSHTGPLAAVAMADAVTPASSVSLSTDSSTSAAAAVEGGAADTHGVRSSGVARSRAASKDAAAATADAAHAGRAESAASETGGLRAAGDSAVPEDEEEKAATRKGSHGPGTHAAGGTDETAERNHAETAVKNLSP